MTVTGTATRLSPVFKQVWLMANPGGNFSAQTSGNTVSRISGLQSWAFLFDAVTTFLFRAWSESLSSLKLGPTGEGGQAG